MIFAADFYFSKSNCIPVIGAPIKFAKPANIVITPNVAVSDSIPHIVMQANGVMGTIAPVIE